MEREKGMLELIRTIFLRKKHTMIARFMKLIHNKAISGLSLN